MKSIIDDELKERAIPDGASTFVGTSDVATKYEASSTLQHSPEQYEEFRAGTLGSEELRKSLAEDEQRKREKQMLNGRVDNMLGKRLHKRAMRERTFRELILPTMRSVPTLHTQKSAHDALGEDDLRKLRNHKKRQRRERKGK